MNVIEGLRPRLVLDNIPLVQKHRGGGGGGGGGDGGGGCVVADLRTRPVMRTTLSTGSVLTASRAAAGEF